MFVATLAIAFWAVQSPYSTPNLDRTINKPRSERSTTIAPWKHPDSDDFQRVAKKRLCGPLYDAPPPKEKEKAKAAPLALKLIGSIIEPGNSMAIFQLADKQTYFKGTGDKLLVGNLEIEIIDVKEDQATVRRGEDSIVLKVEEASGTPGN